MANPRLTIGMATYDDFQGTWWASQCLRMFHSEALDRCEILVVDNNPGSEQGQMVKGLVENWMQGGAFPSRYIAAGEHVGTSAPRNRVFSEAYGDFVMCMDSHVMLQPGSVERLLAWMDTNNDSSDILSGPLYYDNLIRPSSEPDSQSVANLVTHYQDVWRQEMWGIWGNDDRGMDIDGEPFEIPGMGLGTFVCRRDAWLGFNQHARGFGGEELYIHEKFRQAGHKAICLPFLRWLHRFGRPGGVPYPLTRYNKVRNYVLEFNELGLPLDRIHNHFVLGNGEAVPDGSPPQGPLGRMTQAEWDYLVEDPIKNITPRAPKRPGCGSCQVEDAESLDALYLRASGTVSDINEHVPKLRELSEKVKHVTEFGTRNGVSTIALLAGQPDKLLTYDLNASTDVGVWEKHAGKTDTQAIKANVLEVDIEPTDMLFIDTLHTYDQLKAELARHGGKVRRFIALHDTDIYGHRGEGGKVGLLPAMREYMEAHPEWSVIYHARNNHGFTVLGRLKKDKPKLPSKIKMAANFAKHMTEYVMDGAKSAEPETLTRRLEVCTVCEHRSDGACSICGCPVDKKASLNSSYCDLGKWEL